MARRRTGASDAPPVDRRRRRREEKHAKIVAEAWDLAHRDGLAALSLRDVADRVDLQQPSLYSYIDSKLALYDAMFIDGYHQLLDALHEHTFADDPREAMIEFAELLVRFSSEDVVRHQLLFQRTIPGYKPSPEARQLNKELVAIGLERTDALGLAHGDMGFILTGIIAGFSSQQVFNDPGGDRWVRLVRPALDIFFAGADQHPMPEASPTPQKRTTLRKPTNPRKPRKVKR